ncbi:capsule biosynthesis protein [Otariodibacter oris]|uniref:Capsular polysaccharide export protein n=1 Tax=Otariodibacter oris TaxID=1032623 RepID=A0A420XGI2_9PAST|nr:capsule biosynthesis protein [Otariodibacter oris]QGM80103.1 capsule biosynthesis protein [Otariodibacter oris]RKR71930.1 capsular polysaccharide export protein [Otariodibacter oris]
MISHNLDEIVEYSERILLLQGPVGDFFTQLSKWLTEYNKQVFKINFNVGDEYFYPNNLSNTYSYHDKFENFKDYLVKFVNDNKIDTIICFGDNRPYHKIAKSLTKELNMFFWVFEEGYFRPDYVTLEKFGVNAFSKIPKEKAFFQQFYNLPPIGEPQKVKQGFIPVAKVAIQYYWKCIRNRDKYPHYKHHRYLSGRYYLKLWMLSAIRRVYYYFKDNCFSKKIQRGKFGEFFIVPLQVYDDSQVMVHCDYNGVSEFINEVLASFSRYAPHDMNLIIKHHPMDRGFTDYGTVIQENINTYPNLKGRVFYVHDLPLPVLLRQGKGMVCINSTSGLSALVHNLPVKVLGRANYDFDGLTYQGTLNTFWNNSQRPDNDLFLAYRNYHLHKTHLNGNFYSKVILRYPYNNEV